MPITLKNLSSIPESEREPLVSRALRIFFETSGRTGFDSETAKLDFENQYFRSYLEPGCLFYLAIEDGDVLGYLAGTERTLDTHYRMSPYLEHFREEISKHYPSHLHINLTGTARGRGVGGGLIEAFESDLKSRASPGVHIVTLATARNVSFYEKCGFERVAEQTWNGKPLLLMGKTLSRR